MNTHKPTGSETVPNETALHIELHSRLSAVDSILSNKWATADDVTGACLDLQKAFADIEQSSDSERDWLEHLQSEAKAKAKRMFEHALAIQVFAHSSIDVKGDLSASLDGEAA